MATFIYYVIIIIIIIVMKLLVINMTCARIQLICYYVIRRMNFQCKRSVFCFFDMRQKQNKYRYVDYIQQKTIWPLNT